MFWVVVWFMLLSVWRFSCIGWCFGSCFSIEVSCVRLRNVVFFFSEICVVFLVLCFLILSLRLWW